MDVSEDDWTAEQIKDKLGLVGHEEGGYFREVYRSPQYYSINRDNSTVLRNASTAIYYLLSVRPITVLISREKHDAVIIKYYLNRGTYI